MQYPLDIYMSPRKAIMRFTKLLNNCDPHRVETSSRYKQERELVVAGVVLMGIGKANNQQYWMRPAEDISPDIDVRAVTFTRENNQEGTFFHDIQVTEFEGHTDDLITIIASKVTRTLNQGTLNLFVNIRDRNGEVFHTHDIARAIATLNPHFLSIWYVTDDYDNRWLYHLRKVWPDVQAFNFDLEDLLPTLPGPDWVRLSRSAHNRLLPSDGETFDLPLPDCE